VSGQELDPYVIVLAGPNGAGKSTAAPFLLPSALSIAHFVNADVIAQGLSGFRPESVAVEAGRVMLSRLTELADARESFAFETTLSGKHFARRLKDLRSVGYKVHLFFLYLPSADMAVHRVTRRIQLGGHAVPDDVIRRRYELGLRNLFRLYLPLTTSWTIYDNSIGGRPRLIASGAESSAAVLAQPDLFQQLKATYDD
jgi:predicted ABC-type ATPase